MKKDNKPHTINPKYLENLRHTKSSSKTTQRVKQKNENKEDFSKTYRDLMFKKDIGIHKIINYLEKESIPED